MNTIALILNKFGDMLIVWLMKLDVLICILRLGRLSKCLQIMNHILKKERKVNSSVNGVRVSRLSNRCFVRFYIPGWPSKAFRRMVNNEINYYLNPEDIHLNLLIIGFSRRCPLNCQHCLEWDRLGNVEEMGSQQLSYIIEKFQSFGVNQVHFSGGEPMMRYEELLRVLKTARKDCDYWLLTCGYNLTKERLKNLKDLGLTGVSLSLDHWESSFHNAFRGHDKSYEWVMEAVKNVRANNMPLCLSLCATRAFITVNNLEKYYLLGSQLGAQFIQIIEPVNCGRFANKTVQLDEDSIRLLEKFYLEKNSRKTSVHLPTVVYVGYYQRRYGCQSAGYKNLYVDTMGGVHACPFCQKAESICLEEPMQSIIKRLRKNGCHKFQRMKM